jgi:hypothetical protein
VPHCFYTGRAKSRRFVHGEGKAGRFAYEEGKAGRFTYRIPNSCNPGFFL